MLQKLNRFYILLTLMSAERIMGKFLGKSAYCETDPSEFFLMVLSSSPWRCWFVAAVRALS